METNENTAAVSEAPANESGLQTAQSTATDSLPVSAEAEPADENGRAEESVQKENKAKIADAIHNELMRINALDPTVKDFDDILNSDTGAIFTEKVKRGYSLYDAFLVSNQKRILKNVSDSVHQSALNNVNSKNHLTGANASKAEAPIDVPSRTYALYRSMFPELTDSQIRAHYAKHNKK